MYKYKINVLGYEYKVCFMDVKSYEEKNGNGSNGYCNVRLQTIDILISNGSTGDMMWHEMEKTGGHEVAHAIEQGLPTSINQGEGLAVVAEELFKLHKELLVIFKDFKNKYIAKTAKKSPKDKKIA